MTDKGIRTRPWWFHIVLAAILLAGVGNAFAAPDDPSPASGHAQVIAQGVAASPATALAWRVDTPAAEPEKPESSDWTTGFALATRGPILLTDQDDAETRLAPGEAAFVLDGDAIAAQGLTGRRVRYARIEVVAVDDVPEDDRADFLSEPFDAPGGRRDLDLVRDVLAEGESTEVPASDAPILVYATTGALRIRGDDGTTTLDAGEAAAVTGPATLSAHGDDRAAFVAAVIGTDVSAPAVPVPAPTADPPPTGSIQIRFFGCGPEAIGQTAIDAEQCDPLTEGVDATIGSESTGVLLTLADADSGGGLVISSEWSGLPLGPYALSDIVVPPGYDGVVVDPVEQFVELTEEAPDAVFVVYAIDTDG